MKPNKQRHFLPEAGRVATRDWMEALLEECSRKLSLPSVLWMVSFSLLCVFSGCRGSEVQERVSEPGGVYDLMTSEPSAGWPAGVGLEEEPPRAPLMRFASQARAEFLVWLEPGDRLVVAAEAKGELAVTVETDVGTVEHGPVKVGTKRQEMELLGEESGGLARAARISLMAGKRGLKLRQLAVSGPNNDRRDPASVDSVASLRDSELPTKPNIIVYLVDTLRPDHLGFYGYKEPTSPRMDAFSTSAVVFDRAVAQSSWTKASVASIFTGLWPFSHGANKFDHLLQEDHFVLAERLQEAGYATAAFTMNPNITEEFGFSQGFDDFFDLRSQGTRSQVVHHAVSEWLESTDPQKPFFAYVHTIDPHAPYAPPPPHLGRFAATVKEPAQAGSRQQIDRLQSGALDVTPSRLSALLALYDGEIAANDVNFGRLLKRLRTSGLARNTVVVLVSDHGEEFNEHGGFTHGRNLFKETTHIPLAIFVPGLAPSRVKQRVEHVDLFPTLLHLAGAEAPRTDGRSLLPTLLGEELVERAGFGYLLLTGLPRSVVWWRRFELMEVRDDSGVVTPYLFDVEEDPLQQHNLAEELPILREFLHELAERKMREAQPAKEETAEIDEETLRQLEALGYLQ